MMMERIRKQMIEDKKQDVNCIFNKAIMPNKKIAIKGDDVTISINEYERLKQAEQDHHKGLEKVILSDETMEYDLKLMNAILEQR